MALEHEMEIARFKHLYAQPAHCEGQRNKIFIVKQVQHVYLLQ